MLHQIHVQEAVFWLGRRAVQSQQCLLVVDRAIFVQPHLEALEGSQPERKGMRGLRTD